MSGRNGCCRQVPSRGLRPSEHLEEIVWEGAGRMTKGMGQSRLLGKDGAKHPAGLIGWRSLQAVFAVNLVANPDFILIASICISVLGGMLLLGAMRTMFARWQAKRHRPPLARLCNRRAFMEAAERLLNEPPSGPWTVVVADIECFKLANVQEGHAVDESLLHQVGRVLQQQVRPGDLVARFGRNELVLLLQRSSPADAEKLVQRIRHQLGQPILLRYGVAQVVGPLHLITALSLADRQMYMAKHDGRDPLSVNAQQPPASTTGQDTVPAAD